MSATCRNEKERGGEEALGKAGRRQRENMIVGVGTGLIEIERIRKACVKEAFTRLYTEEECRQARGNTARLAGNFTVKEAVAKVFGTGFHFRPQRDQWLGMSWEKAYVMLYGKAEETAKRLGIKNCLYQSAIRPCTHRPMQ